MTPLDRYTEALDALEQAQDDGAEPALLEALLARDALDRSFSTPPDAAAFTHAASLDARLKTLAPKTLEALSHDPLAPWRATRPPPRDPPESAWWWYPPPKATPKEPPGWTLFSFLAGAVAVALVLEVGRRFLQGGESASSLVGTSLQAVIGLVAGGSFTPLGRRWLEALLERWGVRRRTRWRRFLSIGFLGLALGFFGSTSWMADIFEGLGYASYNQGRLSQSIRRFERAVALDPGNAGARYALAFAFEDAFRYQDAQRAYQETTRLDGGFYFAYNNLARLQLLRLDSPGEALALMNRALAQAEDPHNPMTLDPDDPMDQLIRARLLKNRGWAYLQLDFLQLSERDLKAALEVLESPAPHCLLALVHKQRGDEEAELAAWGSCLTVAEPLPQEGSEVETLWRAEGEARLLEEGKSGR